jgi:sialic acid synthase
MFRKQEIMKSKSIVIAEIGQNHQGELELARKYIKVFAETGADVVKFQTRNNKFLFSECAYNKKYDSENSFSDIYGLHREKLELDIEWLPILKADCEKYGVKFMSTPFDEPSLEILCDIGVDILKIASFDIGNLPFLDKISRKKIPIVMSVGGGKLEQIRSSVAILKKHSDDIAILHCVSEYPCEHDRLGLDNIELLSKEFPDLTIGSSDHYSGISSGPIAYMKGARVFEKHVTLNRSWKGADHSFALSTQGFRKFVRDIKRTPEMMKAKPEVELGSEMVFGKLGKSVVTACDLKAGEELTLDNLSGKIYGKQYIPVRETNKIIGKKLNKDIKKGDLILFEDIA